MRFSAAPSGRISNRKAPWVLFGERTDVPDGLEDNALAGVNLAQIATTPGAPMFEAESLFGAHMAGQDLDIANGAPVVVFVHGFQHEPRRPVVARAKSDNPHRAIFHFDETADGPGSREEVRLHTTPWFARAMLQEGRGRPEECAGAAIGFSYASYGGSPDAFLPTWPQRFLTKLGIASSISQPAEPYLNAYRDAEMAGYGLAAVLTQLRARLDHEGHYDKKIDILCHSLGARAVLSALAMVAQRWPQDQTLARIDRVLLLGGACYWGQAASALAHLTFAQPPEGPQFYNFTTQSDDVLRFLAARATARSAFAEAEEDLKLTWPETKMLRGGKTIGRAGCPPHALYQSFGPRYERWVDIALDSPRVAKWGALYGFDLRGQRGFSLGDHWIHYTHPGNWSLYRAILHEREGWSVRDIAEGVGEV